VARTSRSFIPDVMRFLDNVLQSFIDTAPDSMARARYSAMRERSVGLGVMGFHSFLQALNVPFESAIAKVWNRRMFKHIREGADLASRQLAEERGPCPDAAEYGFMERFSNKIAIAPTASISIICGGASPGIEPIAANVYNHKTLSGSYIVRNPHLKKVLAKHGRDDDDTWTAITVSKGSVQHLDFLTQQERDTFKTAFELDQRWVIEHAADRTPFICQSQSGERLPAGQRPQARPAPDPRHGVEEGREVALLLPQPLHPARGCGQPEGGRAGRHHGRAQGPGAALVAAGRAGSARTNGGRGAAARERQRLRRVPGMPVKAEALEPEVAAAATRRAELSRQLDLMREARGPVDQVRRLLEDLDRISLDLARTIERSGEPGSR
jgi:hypothetical protein